MKTKLVIATNNKDKFREINAILKETLGSRLKIISLSDFNIPPVIEDGKTLKENAVKKANEVSRATGLITLAEDTGLEVDYLNGEPGVYSARYAGPGKSYSDNNKKLLSKLKGIPFEKRTAQFRCVAAIVFPDGDIQTAEGIIKGTLTDKERGTAGFGYDPVFLVPEYNKTFAELPLETKNKISHRSKAIHLAALKILEMLKK
ncbi:MAG: XTP/dITP diphosphatase [Elusimicrobiota bacterium]